MHDVSLRASVVVPTRNRPDLLDRCLEALLNQSLCPWDYEVIVADDGASVATRRQVEAWSRQVWEDGHTIRYVPVCDNHGPAAARNAGWRAARGEIVAFTDDDCIPEPGWLASGLASFIDGVTAVSGRVAVPLNGVPTDYERNAALLSESLFVTANCFYRRAALAELGGFDERFELAWREDTDLMMRLLERGRRIVEAPEAVVAHPIRPARWGVSLGQQRKSMYNALLYKKHPRLYRERIQPNPPWHYYRIVAALLIAVSGVLSRNGRLAVLGGLAWIVMTVRFCARRLEDTSRAPAHVAEMIVTSALIPPLSIFWRIRGAIRYRVWFL